MNAVEQLCLVGGGGGRAGLKLDLVTRHKDKKDDEISCDLSGSILNQLSAQMWCLSINYTNNSTLVHPHRFRLLESQMVPAEEEKLCFKSAFLSKR